jgi:signal transduction histidine kinase/CheY-like chemotaxis protein
MIFRLINLEIRSEQDMLAVRQRARQISALLEFGTQDQVRIATAASELARTLFAFAAGGNVEFSLDQLGAHASLLVHIKSSGAAASSATLPNDSSTNQLPNGQKPMVRGSDVRIDVRSSDDSKTTASQSEAATLKSALISAQRLMDECTLEKHPGQIRVITLRKSLPPTRLMTTSTLHALIDHLLILPVSNTFDEITLQNRDLLETLAELRNRQEDLLILTRELEDTNRGVVALYAEIEEKAERLRQADVFKDEFLATLAHELRNPLAPIRNAVEVMRRADPENHAVHQRSQQVIARQVDHLARLVDDLLDVARISKGKIRLKQVPTELAAFVETAVEAIQPLIDSRGHQLIVELPANPVQIMGDPVRLAQIIGNLLNNAAKYTTRGGKVTLQAELQANHVLRIIVRDNGMGLAPERITSVFTMFAQGDAAPDRAQDGLGIGLSLVKQLVLLHEGKIWAESPGVGQGCSFFIELPVMQAEAALLVLSTNPKDNHMVAYPAGRNNEEPFSILLVDDNADSVNMNAMLLDSYGYTTYIAQEADTAITLAERHLPAIVFLDIGLPGKNGYEIAKILRQNPALQATMLVAVTGYGTEQDRKKAFDAGFDEHLVKPVEIKLLLQIVEEKSNQVAYLSQL